jgi:hypothetical protein
MAIVAGMAELRLDSEAQPQRRSIGRLFTGWRASGCGEVQRDAE